MIKKYFELYRAVHPDNVKFIDFCEAEFLKNYKILKDFSNKEIDFGLLKLKNFKIPAPGLNFYDDETIQARKKLKKCESVLLQEINRFAAACTSGIFNTYILEEIEDKTRALRCAVML